jgi:nucleoside-diphosphate-sugar epimerase
MITIVAPGKSILLTGAAGFLGTEIVRQLQARGLKPSTTDIRGTVDFCGDLADADFVSSLPDVETVIHVAAVQYVTPTLPFFRREPWFLRNNVEATKNLKARYSGKVGYFLQVGTSMMYDQTGLAHYTTKSPLKGVGVYSKSKLASIRLAQDMKNAVGIMIPCIIGGRGREGLFRGFVKTMTRYGFALQPGNCQHPIHMVHVEDTASLIRLMVERKATGFYNAAAPEPLSIDQWIDIIRDELKLGAIRRIHIPYSLLRFGAWVTRYRILAREQQLMLGQSHVLDTSESLALGWKPTHSNERIVRDIALYVGSE